MEDTDLIRFCSPEGYASPSRSTFSNSPGSNPFDAIWNLAENFTKNTLVEELPFEAFDKSFSNFNGLVNYTSGRESLGIINVEEFSRESLGILKSDVLNTPMDDLNFNLTSRKGRNSIDTSILNTAFLCPLSYCDKSGYFSNSSLSPNLLEFNSCSLEASEPSKIYSVNSSQFSRNTDLLSNTENALNVAFINSINGSLRPNEHESRSRLTSLPELNTVKERIDSLLSKSENFMDMKNSSFNESEHVSPKVNVDDAFNDSLLIEANHFASKLADGSILSTKCFEDNLLDYTSPPVFDDEVEACDSREPNNGDVFKCIDKLLPSLEDKDITSPALDCYLNCDVSTMPISVEPNTKQHLSTKDQYFLEMKQNLSSIFNKERSSSNSTSKDANELLHNLSEIINNEKRDLKQNLEGQRLLYGLADILCSVVPLQGPIDSLDDSGHSSIEHEEQQTENDHNSYEVLDLRIPKKTSNSDQALDLSLKSHHHSYSFNFPTQKVSDPLLLNERKPRSTSASSASSFNHGKIKSCRSVTLKPKRIEDNILTKRGPLKAVIPVGNMSKHQRGACSWSLGFRTAGRRRLYLDSRNAAKMPSICVTPPKTENSHSTLFKVKRTSTPIMEPDLKPVAQSTPDGPNSQLDNSKASCNTPRMLSKLKSYSPQSSQVPKRINTGENLSTSALLNNSNPIGTTANSTNRPLLQSANLIRRHSESELKSNKPAPLKRSYSIGKSSRTSGVSVPSFKHDVLVVKNLTSKGSTSNEISKSGVLQKTNRGISNMKPISLLAKLKKNKMDKENIIYN